jgi:hypothetical protein
MLCGCTLETWFLANMLEPISAITTRNDFILIREYNFSRRANTGKLR